MPRSPSVPDCTTDLSLPDEGDKDAKEFGINVSQTCERAIQRAVQAQTDHQWVSRYADFVRAYNEMLDRDGLPLAQYRTFG